MAACRVLTDDGPEAIDLRPALRRPLPREGGGGLGRGSKSSVAPHPRFLSQGRGEFGNDNMVATPQFCPGGTAVPTGVPSTHRARPCAGTTVAPSHVTLALDPHDRHQPAAPAIIGGTVSGAAAAILYNYARKTQAKGLLETIHEDDILSDPFGVQGMGGF